MCPFAVWEPLTVSHTFMVVHADRARTQMVCLRRTEKNSEADFHNTAVPYLCTYVMAISTTTMMEQVLKELLTLLCGNRLCNYN